MQKRAKKIVKGLERKPHEECVRSLDLFSLEEKRLEQDLIEIFSFFTRRHKMTSSDPFCVVNSDKTQGNDVKVREVEVVYQDKFFHPEHVGHWNRLREVITVPSPTGFEKSLDNALRHMGTSLWVVLC